MGRGHFRPGFIVFLSFLRIPWSVFLRYVRRGDESRTTIPAPDCVRTSKTPVNKFLKYHAPALAYATLIIVVSSIEKLTAPEIEWLSTDKLAHVLEYALFAFLVYRSFSNMPPLSKGTLPTLSALLFLILFAASDEFHQKFVEGRTADALDVLADVLGGSVVILLMHRRRKRRLIEAGSAPLVEKRPTESESAQ